MIKSTAQTIVKAALATLRDEGFAGTTSRAIARRGDFNQALIFYHFGSLESLLVTALRQTSDERLARYREVVSPIATLEGLLPAMTDLWEEDRAAGHVQIVAQLMAGSVGRPELSKHVVELMEPWIELAEETLARVLPAGLPVADIAFGTVVWYVGMNLMTQLDPAGTRADALIAGGREWAPAIAPLLDGLR